MSEQMVRTMKRGIRKMESLQESRQIKYHAEIDCYHSYQGTVAKVDEIATKDLLIACHCRRDQGTLTLKGCQAEKALSQQKTYMRG